MWGLSPSDNNSQIDAYKAAHGITNPCAGTQGGGPAAIGIVTDGQNFLGYPTYCVVCPDKSMYFDACYPPTVTCLEGVIADCPTVSISATFTSDLTEVCETEVIGYEDMSTGNITSWTWTFEGGEPATSTDQNPMVAYNTAGEFDVTLEVSDGTETNTVFMENYITVFDLPETILEVFDDMCLGDPEFELSGGTPIGGEYSGTGVTDGWFFPDAAGIGTHTITYTYTDENDCMNFDEQTIVVDDCTGITEFGDQSMQLYPNPSTGIFEVELNYQGNFSIQIYSIVGDKVYEVETSANGYYHNTIDLSTLESGIYFVSFKSDNETIVKKLKLLSK